MLNYKIERILFAVCWLGMIVILATIIPPQHVTPLLVYQYVFGSLIITLAIYCIYQKVRNYIIKNTIHRYFYTNDYDNGNSYISKCIRKQPKLFWIKYEMLTLLALSGDISGCVAYSAQLKKTRQFRKKQYHNRICRLDNICSYIKQEPLMNILKATDDQTLLEKANNLLLALPDEKADDIIDEAMTIYSSPYFFYKSFSAMILSETYKKTGDDKNGTLYADKAIEYAQTSEMSRCIKMRLE